MHIVTRKPNTLYKKTSIIRLNISIRRWSVVVCIPTLERWERETSIIRLNISIRRWSVVVCIPTLERWERENTLYKKTSIIRLNISIRRWIVVVCIPTLERWEREKKLPLFTTHNESCYIPFFIKSVWAIRSYCPRP